MRKFLAFCAFSLAVSIQAQVSWTQLTSMPTPRAQTAATIDASGKVYVIGGYTSGSGSALNTVEIYDSATNTWSTGPALLAPTRGASAVFLNNSVYVFGGFDSSQSAIYQVLNLATNTWTQGVFSAGGWEGAAAVANGRIFVLGGEANATAVNEFLPGSGSFTSLTSLTAGAIGSTAAAVGNQVYLIGGGAGYTPANTRLDVFDLSTGQWSSRPGDTTPLTQHTSVSVGPYLYVLGGSSSATNNVSPYYSAVRIYDTDSGLWSSGTALPFGVREASAVFTGSQILLLGGFNDQGAPSGQVLALAVPEPSTYALLVLGGGLLALAARRRLRR